MMFVYSFEASEIAQEHVKHRFRGLEPGWWRDRQIDLRDFQYAFFRSNLPLLLSVAISHLALSHTVRGMFPGNRLALRAVLLVFGLIFNIYVYGSGVLFMLGALFLNYCISLMRDSSLVPIVTWSFNLAILVCDFCKFFSPPPLILQINSF